VDRDRESKWKDIQNRMEKDVRIFTASKVGTESLAAIMEFMYSTFNACQSTTAPGHEVNVAVGSQAVYTLRDFHGGRSVLAERGSSIEVLRGEKWSGRSTGLTGEEPRGSRHGVACLRETWVAFIPLQFYAWVDSGSEADGEISCSSVSPHLFHLIYAYLPFLANTGFSIFVS
jgi:hypothetical protein